MKVECRSLKMVRERLVFCSMRLGVPFIAPRHLGAVEQNLGRLILPSFVWCTGQSGAPPDSHCSCPVHDCLSNKAQMTIADSWQLAHRTLSSAHRTVRCPLPIVGSATCLARIARPTVGSPNSPVHTGQSGELYSYAVNLLPESSKFA